ncbi:MAG: long-chain-fatty-acid---luciferin-component ligase [Thermoleophilaceae bacterium]|nr:long-chain-fatty-acid---luciferin-component ligase [Thermoleophilaceae bacterium]
MSAIATVSRSVRPEGLGSLEELIYEGQGSYARSPSDAQRVAWIAAAAEHHLERSAAFRRLAERRGFTPDGLRSTGDLAGVPVVSSSLFKRAAPELVPGADVKLCRSSGTRGAESQIVRDRPTLERLIGTVLHGLREFLGHSEAREAFVLGPPASAAGDVWFAYVLTLVELLYDTGFFVTDGRLCHRALYEALAGLDEDVQPAVVAPPGLLLDFLSWMGERSLTLDLQPHRPFVITAGGWKRREDEAVDRASLTALVGERLSVPPERVRDAFNMVELNTVLFECEHARKHVPPWLTVIPRRPSDMHPAEPGDTGLLAFLDPTATSYPGFVLSEDFGFLHPEGCPCGRAGDTLALTRRLATVEQRGCGLKLERYAR